MTTTITPPVPSFDAARQPCVPVLSSGEPRLVSLREALVSAHELDEVQHEIPTVEFGLYRLLIALVLDALFIEPRQKLNDDSLADLIERGRFDAAGIDAYFERHADKFDLFHHEFPFLQTGGLGGKEKPLANLLPSVPSGTNVTHFHRAHEDDFAVGPEEALGLLASIAPFMTAGGAGLSPSINGAPPVYVLVQGQNLFETLCFNVAAQELPLASPDDKPAWRASNIPGVERQSSGHVESLTWRPRRVRLTPKMTSRGTAVGTMKFEAGDRTTFKWRDPNAAYWLKEKGPQVVRLQEGRDLWRDVGPLALLREASTALRPLVVEQFARFVEERLLPGTTALDLVLYGMRTDNAKVFEWRRDELHLPAALLLRGSEAKFGEEVQQRWLTQAEQVAFSLRQAIKRLYPRDGGGNDKAFNGRAAYVERTYWSALRPTFEDLLFRLAATDGGLAAREPLRAEWRRDVEREARSAFEWASDGLGTDPHSLERATRARRFLEGGLKRVFDPNPVPAASRRRK